MVVCNSLFNQFYPSRIQWHSKLYCSNMMHFGCVVWMDGRQKNNGAFILKTSTTTTKNKRWKQSENSENGKQWQNKYLHLEMISFLASVNWILEIHCDGLPKTIDAMALAWTDPSTKHYFLSLSLAFLVKCNPTFIKFIFLFSFPFHVYARVCGI